MKLFRLLLAVGLAAVPALAERHTLAQFNPQTEEGKVLQAISTEQDGNRKLALMEEFASKYPKHEATSWVLYQMQTDALKANQFDKAIDAGEKLLAMDPLDVDAAYNNLKAAEGKKDTTAIIRWAQMTSSLARKAEGVPKGPQQSEEDHKTAVESAKNSSLYSDYALSNAALTETDSAKAMAAVDALATQNPGSQYLDAALPKYIYAARQTNNTPAAVALGEKAAATGVFNEDLLLLMADYYMNQKKDAAKTVAYSSKLVEVLGGKQKPQGVSDADWDKKRNTMLGLGYWMEGTTLSSVPDKHAEADKALRASLPLIQGNDQLMGPALFYLGLVNYQMGKGVKGGSPRTADAVKFMQQSASIKGPFQAKAQSNVAVMRKESAAR
jgi:tetratricopeptide (TPR) repeat protein